MAAVMAAVSSLEDRHFREVRIETATLDRYSQS